MPQETNPTPMLYSRIYKQRYTATKQTISTRHTQHNSMIDILIKTAILYYPPNTPCQKSELKNYELLFIYFFHALSLCHPRSGISDSQNKSNNWLWYSVASPMQNQYTTTITSMFKFHDRQVIIPTNGNKIGQLDLEKTRSQNRLPACIFSVH